MVRCCSPTLLFMCMPLELECATLPSALSSQTLCTQFVRAKWWTLWRTHTLSNLHTYISSFTEYAGEVDYPDNRPNDDSDCIELSLATALTSSKTDFSNELIYMPNTAPRSWNLARLEVGGMQDSKSSPEIML